MTAQIIQIRTPRQPTEAERYVIDLAERAEHLERAKMMEALANAVLTLRSIAELSKKGTW